MQTSGTIAVPSGCRAAAISMLVKRFSLPSVRNCPMGSWLPVMITGFDSPSRIKLRKDAV